MSDVVLYEVKDQVAVITLNSPKNLNSMTEALLTGLVDGIKQANADDDIGAIILTGTGRSYSVGGDMNESFLPKARGEVPYDEDDNQLGGLGFPIEWASFIRESKPIVAAVNGLAVGGGVTSLLPCDVIIAAESAAFSFMFLKLGIVPELGSSHYLAARVGFGRASEILLSARNVDAQEAEQIGLVNKTVADDALMDTALEYAKRIAAYPAPMLAMTKRLVSENFSESDIPTLLKRESDALRECFTLPEHKEAVEAFLEKRPPDFAKLRKGK